MKKIDNTVAMFVRLKFRHVITISRNLYMDGSETSTYGALSKINPQPLTFAVVFVSQVAPHPRSLKLDR